MSSQNGGGAPPRDGRWQPLDDGSLMAGSTLARHSADIEDLLQAVPDRSDLERLYRRDVPMSQILRLLGRNIEPQQIDYLLRCDEPRREIRKFLESR